MQWKQSSFCKADQPMCAQVKELPNGTRLMRNSTDVGAEISLTATEWEAFIAGVKAGEFD